MSLFIHVQQRAKQKKSCSYFPSHLLRLRSIEKLNSDFPIFTQKIPTKVEDIITKISNSHFILIEYLNQKLTKIFVLK